MMKKTEIMEHLYNSVAFADLNGTKITDKGLKHLKEIPLLQWLDLSGTNVTKAGIEELKKSLPECKIYC